MKSTFYLITTLLGLASAAFTYDQDNAEDHLPELKRDVEVSWHVSYDEQSSVDGNYADMNTGGALYAMSYTPYKTENGQSRCASVEEVEADIASIAAKRFRTVRSYATDCDGLVHIANACKASGLNMIVGVYVDHAGVQSEEVAHQIEDIKTYFDGDYSIVEMVLLGNEALFNDFALPSQMAEAIANLRQELRDAGYDGPVSTAETVAEIAANQDVLCDQLDLIAANIHPFFSEGVTAATAGEFVDTQLNLLQGLCGGTKYVFNSETGWPSAGLSHGDAIPSPAEQVKAIQSIANIAGGESVFYSFEDDEWKEAGYLGVESSWGCGHLFLG